MLLLKKLSKCTYDLIAFNRRNKHERGNYGDLVSLCLSFSSPFPFLSFPFPFPFSPLFFRRREGVGGGPAGQFSN